MAENTSVEMEVNMIPACEPSSRHTTISCQVGHPSARPLTLEEISRRTWLKPSIRRADNRIEDKVIASAEGFSEAVIHQFFTAVGNGCLSVLEHCLTEYPGLAYVSDDLRDVAGREFTKISALQYAWWSGDIPMCQLIFRYLPDWMGAYQVKLLQNRQKNRFDPLFSLSKSIKAYDSYCDYCFRNPKAVVAQKSQRWQEDVGVAQSSWPAWIRYKFTEVGKDAAWPQMAIKNTYARQTTDIYRHWNDLLDSGKAMYRNKAIKPYAILYLGSHGDHPLDKFNLDAEHRELTRYRRRMGRVFKRLLVEKNL